MAGTQRPEQSARRPRDGPAARGLGPTSSWSTDQDAQLRTYLIPDLAGNVTTLVLKVRTAQHETDQLQAQFVSVQYGSAVPFIFARNLEAFELELAKNNVVRSLQQQVRVGVGQQRQSIDADFEAHENTTEIEVQSPGKHQHLTKPGLDLVQILTSKGQLSIAY